MTINKNNVQTLALSAAIAAVLSVSAVSAEETDSSIIINQSENNIDSVINIRQGSDGFDAAVAGSTPLAEVNQLGGTNNMADIMQFNASDSLASATQEGFGNQVMIDQRFVQGASATTNQSGEGNMANVYQGDDLGMTSQVAANIEQMGMTNMALVGQHGVMESEANIRQEGHMNNADIIQAGGDMQMSGEMMPSGTAMGGTNLVATIQQMGDNNNAHIGQFNSSDSVAMIEMMGNDNTAMLTQDYTVNSHASINLNGEGNVVEALQTVSMDGMPSADNDLNYSAFGNMNNATITQYGSGHHLNVTQNGDGGNIDLCQGTNCI